ncbi:ester cyclase [Thalassolituus sp. LLYu03]|uniref:ester cyclase n=1 Tax=Thalassolituus sp. LLYu03 TaxID=3421656 RepID=UPI003D28FA22
MSDFNKRLVEHFIQLSWNTGRFNLLRHIVSHDFVYHTSFAEGFKDFDGFINYLQEIRSALPDLDVSVEDIMAEGDRVITVSTFSGSFEKPVFGMQPNGLVVSFMGISTWQIRRGKVCSQNTLVDIAELQRQLAVSSGKGIPKAG